MHAVINCKQVVLRERLTYFWGKFLLQSFYKKKLWLSASRPQLKKYIKACENLGTEIT